MSVFSLFLLIQQTYAELAYSELIKVPHRFNTKSVVFKLKRKIADIRRRQNLDKIYV